VLNVTAAVLWASAGIAPDRIREGLENFAGVDRRFQHKGRASGVSVIDDYGHHPRRFAPLWLRRQCDSSASRGLSAARYTRTRDLLDEFAAPFSDADTSLFLRYPIPPASLQLADSPARRLGESLAVERKTRAL